MRFLSAIIITAIAGFAVNGCYASEKINPINKVMQRNQLQSEASRLVEEGMYDQAISKYRESIRPEYINADHEKAFSVGSITDTLKLQNRYQEALDEYRWFLRHDKSAESAMEQYQQIEALISFSKSGDPAPMQSFS